MKIQEILDIKSIKIGLQVGNKKALLESMLEFAVNSGRIINPDDVKKEVYEREKIKSTGIGKGVALPHARTNSISDATASFAVLETPIEYDSIDGSQVNMVFLLIGLENKVGSHLRILSRLSRLFSDDELREKLLSAKKPEEVLRLFRQYDEDWFND